MIKHDKSNMAENIVTTTIVILKILLNMLARPYNLDLPRHVMKKRVLLCMMMVIKAVTVLGSPFSSLARVITKTNNK